MLALTTVILCNEQKTREYCDKLKIPSTNAMETQERWSQDSEVVPRTKIDDDIIQYHLNQVERQPIITLNELQECMRTDLPAKPKVTHLAVSKRLDGLMYPCSGIHWRSNFHFDNLQTGWWEMG